MSVSATFGRVGVYLDNYALIDLARGDTARRDRVIGAFHNGADLMLSTTNVAELIGPECASTVEALKAFLDRIGPHWFPIEGPDLPHVMEREASGSSPEIACKADWFMEMFIRVRTRSLPSDQRLNPVDPEFLRLSFVLDWLGQQRLELKERLAAFDRELGRVLAQLRLAYETNRTGFEQLLPPPRFDASRPATFAWAGLLRTLTYEAKAYRFKKGDGADLCHAVMGAAYAGFALLDKQWKRRVGSLAEAEWIGQGLLPTGTGPLRCRP